MKEEVIPAKGHADFVKTVGKEATEGDERYHVYVCLVFNEADARGKRRYSSLSYQILLITRGIYAFYTTFRELS